MASESMTCGTSAGVCCDEIHDPSPAPGLPLHGWSSTAFEEMCDACADPDWLQDCPDCEDAMAEHSAGVVDCADAAVCTGCPPPPLPPLPEMDDASFQHLLACCCCPPDPPPTYTCGWRDCTLAFASHADLTLHVNHVHLGLPDFTASSSSRASSLPPRTPLPPAAPFIAIPAPSKCKWDDCQMDLPQPLGPSSTTDMSSIFLQHLFDHHLRRPPPSLPVVVDPSPIQDPGPPARAQSPIHPGTGGDHICRWLGCGLGFDSPAALMVHVTDDHVGSKKATYVCEWDDCPRALEGRVFSQRQKVLRHMQTHTGDKPFTCTVCGKSFAEATTLAQHHRTHTRERPYPCTECGKSFALASALTIHMRTHTGDKPFKCPEPGCTASFAESSNLRKHIRIHSGDRPFRCNEGGCGKAFQRSDQLARHMKTHEAPL